MSEYVCTKVRFTFWDGKTLYTVEYTPSLRTWFIFDGDTESGCLEKYPLGKKDKAICNHTTAEEHLNKFLETKNKAHE
jgi:hypothetical protein